MSLGLDALMNTATQHARYFVSYKDSDVVPTGAMSTECVPDCREQLDEPHLQPSRSP